MRRCFIASLRALVVVLCCAGGSAIAGTSGAEVTDYQPGTAPAGQQNTLAAVGLPQRQTGFGAVTPFNPPYEPTDIVTVGAGGSITVRLGAIVLNTPGMRIGVFNGNGIQDVDPFVDFGGGNFSGGRGIAGSPPKLFANASRATVSVSLDGTIFEALPGERVFENPTNGYTDNDIDQYFGSTGTVGTDPFKPFEGSLVDFSGLRYRDDQATFDILRLLNGSAGGTWLDLNGVLLPAFQYVKFDVAPGQRFVLDAVTAIPEPGVLLLVAGPLVVLLQRRRRS